MKIADFRKMIAEGIVAECGMEPTDEQLDEILGGLKSLFNKSSELGADAKALVGKGVNAYQSGEAQAAVDSALAAVTDRVKGLLRATNQLWMALEKSSMDDKAKVRIQKAITKMEHGLADGMAVADPANFQARNKHVNDMPPSSGGNRVKKYAFPVFREGMELDEKTYRKLSEEIEAQLDNMSEEELQELLGGLRGLATGAANAAKGAVQKIGQAGKDAVQGAQSSYRAGEQDAAAKRAEDAFQNFVNRVGQARDLAKGNPIALKRIDNLLAKVPRQ